MKSLRIFLFFLLMFCISLSFVAQGVAADRMLTLSVSEAMANSKVASKLNDKIKLYWGKQEHPRVASRYGEYKTTKRANAFMKSKTKACQWALASALIALQQRAEREGGNAVINIKSNIKNNEWSSETEYRCLAGGMMVNVALKGTVVKLK